MSAARKPRTRKSSASDARVSKKPKVRAKTSKKTTARRSTSSKTGAGKTAKKTSAKRSKAAADAPKSTRKPTAKKATARAATKRSAAASSGRAPKKTSAKRTATRSRSPKLDRKSLAKIRSDLQEERRGHEAQIEELEQDSFQGTQSELTGEVGIDEDFADAGSATFDREQALSIHNNNRDLIDQVDRALYRIEEGTYGACERCGRPIDAARLKALPRTLLCTDCKRREERAR
ncbi:MAG: TraR/DksA C4-type zinc finger protein [Actinomycetota bacterium]